MTASTILSENHILACLAKHFPNYPDHVLLGRGDDCAVIATNGALCVSTDIFSEHVHFRRSYYRPEDIGFKALAVNLSDLAAQGATPKAFTLSLSIPPDMDMDSIDKLFSGMASLAHTHNIPLVGGDIARAEALHLCITVMGETPIPLLRGQAKAGDLIFCIGELGLSRVGLHALLHNAHDAYTQFPQSCQAHLRPQPRLIDGIRLAGLATTLALEAGHSLEDALYGHVPAEAIGRLALMDVSDGLARDLPRLLGHPFNAMLGARITIGLPTKELSDYINVHEPTLTPQQFMALGGEDYALIGTCSPKIAVLVMTTVAEAKLLGEVTGDGVFLCNDMPIPQGFDHFA